MHSGDGVSGASGDITVAVGTSSGAAAGGSLNLFAGTTSATANGGAVSIASNRFSFCLGERAVKVGCWLDLSGRTRPISRLRE
jgi:uncharacterized protein (DUF2345 family)